VQSQPGSGEIRPEFASTDGTPTPVPGRQLRPTLVFGLLAGTTALALFILIYGSELWREHARDAPASASQPTSPATELPVRTVAVLPFENLSADAGDAFVATGIAESILHRMAANQDLTVIARTSSFAVGTGTADARSIARDLNARYLVEGSVQRAGGQLRVTSQLIDASRDAHVWSLRFDRDIDDIFAVEDEIARNIATALDVSLNSEQHPYASFGTEAYLEYLQGRALIATNRIEDAERAIEHFERAIDIEPKFAAAYAALADAHWQSALLQQTSGTGLGFLIRSDRQQARLEAVAREVRPLLDRAFELDDTLAEAYVLRADLKELEGDNAGAEEDYVRGLALNPSYAKGHERYGSFLWSNGGGDDTAVAEIEAAMRLDPLAARHHYVLGAMMQSGGLDPADVEPHLLRALVLDPDYHPALQRLGFVRWLQGHYAEAIELTERALAIDPHAEWVRWPLAQFYLDVTDADAARSVLLEAPEAVPPYDWLAICLYDGEALRAAELLRTDPSFRYIIDVDIRASAIRDAARVSGRYADARQQLLDLPYFHGRGAGEHFTALALAHVYLGLGDRDEAEKLAQSIVDTEDHGYRRAVALMVLGQTDAALAALEENYASQEAGEQRWWRSWYVYERDPSFDAVRENPRFRALAAKARAHAEKEKAAVEKMRQRGQVPERPVPAAPGVC
jgi:TolB-like protein/Tfp pilus assembly protein PilF